MKCMVIIFAQDVRLSVDSIRTIWKKINIISARGITGVASHGKHTRANEVTEHVKK